MGSSSGKLTARSAPIPREAAISVQEARAALAGVEGLLGSALGVGSTWECQAVADALDLVEQARRYLQGVHDDVR